MSETVAVASLREASTAMCSALSDRMLHFVWQSQDSSGPSRQPLGRLSPKQVLIAVEAHPYFGWYHRYPATA